MAMSKKRLVAVAFTLVVLGTILGGIQFVEEARANFSPKNPIITINSPMPYHTYNITSITINVTVRTAFDYFNDSNNGAGSRTITYSLDYQTPVKMVSYFKDEGLFTISTAEKTITGLTSGRHTLEITATNNYSAWNPNFVLTGKNTTIFFGDACLPNPIPLNPTMKPTPTTKPSPKNTASPSPTPSPTLSTTIAPSSTPSPTPITTTEPTSTPKHQTGFFGTNLPTEAGYAAIAAAAVVIAVGVVLFYFRRIRK